MAYVPHVLIAFGGTLPARTAADEIWSCTIRAFPGATGGPANMGGAGVDYGAYATALAPALKAWFTGGTVNPVSTQCNLTYVKVNPIGPDGKYSDDDASNTVAISGANGQSSLAGISFTCLATSWGSDKLRGPASRGRMYLPTYAGAPAGTAVATTSHRANVLSYSLALVSAIRTPTAGLNGGQMTPALVSPIGGAWSYIRTARVGDVWDTQRRRKNAVAEQYIAGGISP